MLWLTSEILLEEKSLFIISTEEKSVLFSNIDHWCNSSLWYKIAKDKEVSYCILEKNNLPIIKTIYLSKWEYEKGWFDDSGLTYPLVVKPILWAHGDWVMMNILNKIQVKQSIEITFEKHERIIIQDQTIWDEYRILVMDDEVIVAMRRELPTVLWNWTETIRKLVAIENSSNPLRWEWYEDHLSFIKIDIESEKTLETQWFTLDSIPWEWIVVQVRSNSNIWSWGYITGVTDIISETIKDIAIQATKSCHLRLAWIDILTTDITSEDSNKCSILEVNATPWLWWDKELTSVNTGRVILKKIFDIK